MKRYIILGISLLGISGAMAQTPLSLESSKRMAVEHNIELQNSQLEVDAAREVQKHAKTQYFPKADAYVMGFVGIDPLIEMDNPGGNLPVYDGNPENLATANQFAYMPESSIGFMQKAGIGAINIAQPVYLGGRIRTGNKLAQLNVDAKQEQAQLTEKQVLIKTEQQYWQLVSLQEKQKTLAEYEGLLMAVRQQVEDARSAGLVIQNDVLKVQIKQQELALNKHRLEQGKQLAIRQFCQTIGLDYDSTLVLQEEISILPAPTSVRVSTEDALTQRAEYRLLGKSVEAAKLQTQMTKGELMPQVAVGALGYYNHTLDSDLGGVGNGMLYGTISIPLTDWWGGSYKIKERELHERIAENTQVDTENLLRLQIEKVWQDVEMADRQIRLLEETLRQTEENLRVTQTSYDQGMVNLSDLLEAQALQVETAERLIEAKTHYRLAISEYLQVTGR
ncbi:TolC family protein [Pontibacter sp. G13]|uniref:TolC family protein n=1 Tax=Pontibacter sp. G13 TaxID=3074898 RepID=UPI00288AC3E7|nr:TolC family protein [Pontibacter sp. G13]WNJ17431.1 TolC family protein [Pontibacter sp. G13]